LAQKFEALTSKRHYRDPMKIDDAFDHLLQNVEIHFDKQCVKALIVFYNNNYSDEHSFPQGDIATLKMAEFNNDN
jgi:HD-GYP domain-containing protein (c-di-GMP phosphodiesterase class II)